jgi:hypothetical protein
LGGSEENLPESSPGLQTAPAVCNIQIKYTLNYPSQIRPLSRHYLHAKIRKKKLFLYYWEKLHYIAVPFPGDL